MIVELSGGGDLCTNARPILVLRAGDGDEAAVLMRLSALIARGVSPNTVLINGIEAEENRV